MAIISIGKDKGKEVKVLNFRHDIAMCSDGNIRKITDLILSKDELDDLTIDSMINIFMK